MHLYVFLVLSALALQACADPTQQQLQPAVQPPQSQGQQLTQPPQQQPQLDLVANDPSQSGLLDANSNVGKLHAMFDNGPASRRHFDECHWYPNDPHLTVGFGHAAEGGLVSQFRNLFNEPTSAQAKQAFLTTFVGQLDATHWQQFSADAGVAEHTVQGLEQGLKKLLTDKAALRAWQGKVNNGFMKPNWFCKGLKTAFRVRVVAEWQISMWAANVVGGGQRYAARYGIDTLGGIASFASFKSTGGTPSRLSGSATIQLQASCNLPARTLTWNWDAVPSEAGGASLKEWRSYVIWQMYQAKKAAGYRRKNRCKRAQQYMTQNRARMNEIWKAWYAPSWGSFPGDPNKINRHTGTPMAAGGFSNAIVPGGGGGGGGVTGNPTTGTTATQTPTTTQHAQQASKPPPAPGSHPSVLYGCTNGAQGGCIDEEKAVCSVPLLKEKCKGDDHIRCCPTPGVVQTKEEAAQAAQNKPSVLDRAKNVVKNGWQALVSRLHGQQQPPTAQSQPTPQQ